jgi:hypothetical protein
MNRVNRFFGAADGEEDAVDSRFEGIYYQRSAESPQLFSIREIRVIRG